MSNPYPTPETMEQTRVGITRWLREAAPKIWPEQHLSGSRFTAPPGMPPLRVRSAGIEVNPFAATALNRPVEADREQFIRLARYYETSLTRAKKYYISQEMTHLAMRTQMEQFRLTVDMLPSPEGFLVWGQPIGDAEKFIPRTAWLGMDGAITENTEDVSAIHRRNPFLDADVPVIAAAWKYEPDYGQVWVTIYTHNADIQNMLRSMLGEYATPDELDRLRTMTPPLAFEREQGLPLDQTLNWFEADPGDGPKLELSAYADLKHLPPELWAKAEAANEDVAPQMTAMVRTLVATWMLMKWKIANREEITAPHHLVKQLARETGKARAQVKDDSKTTVVRLGAPLRHRRPAEGSASRKWKVRAIIGPYVRTRQYIPAWDAYDDTPRLIEPYIAGPEGAPLSNPDKVFLLE